ncbi:helix-turn-helix domain-containing protein [Saccharopolyspora shandongensis]|uniref:helix-turn-helix domain-containing protein n=1 Tax=Saccharopolyspora shandongensis TaxID=418495 RepID=UPI0033EE46C0
MLGTVLGFLVEFLVDVLMFAEWWEGTLMRMTSNDPGPLVQRLVLGAELRELRESHGLSADEAAAALGWYRNKISKIETGESKLSDKDAHALAALYGAAAKSTDKVLALAKEARRKIPPARVPDWAKKYVNLETNASEIKLFFGDSIPGMLQTREYARELLSASVVVPSVDVDEMAESRERRSARFFGDSSPMLWVVLGEEAIRRRVGGRDVHRAQLAQLRSLAELDHVTVQVIPLEGGAHAGLGIAFTLLHLEHANSSIAYIESLTGSDYLSRPQHTRAYSLVFDRLRVAALSDRDTLSLINREIEALG